jgi:hypothetical protein
MKERKKGYSIEINFKYIDVDIISNSHKII